MTRLELQDAIYRQDGYIQNLQNKILKIKDEKEKCNRDIKKIQDGKNAVQRSTDDVISDISKKFSQFPSNCNASRKIEEKFKSILRGKEVADSISSLIEAIKELSRQLDNLDNEQRQVEEELRQARIYRDGLQVQISQTEG